MDMPSRNDGKSLGLREYVGLKSRRHQAEGLNFMVSSSTEERKGQRLPYSLPVSLAGLPRSESWVLQHYQINVSLQTEYETTEHRELFPCHRAFAHAVPSIENTMQWKYNMSHIGNLKFSSTHF